MLPEDIVNPKVDSLSVITYLSQFPEAKLRPGAPIKDRGDPSKLKVYGDGLKSVGISISDSHAEFFVDVSEAKPFGSLKVAITGPNNVEVKPEVSFKDNIYTFRYIPGEEGQYNIKILWWGKPIPSCPYIVNVTARKRAKSVSTSWQGTYKVYGPGIEGKDLRANEPTEFWVEGLPSNANLQVKVNGPKGQLGTSFINVENTGKGSFAVLYLPPFAGLYKINLVVAGKDISASPYTVKVEEPATEIVGWAKGPGVEGIGIEAGKATWFYVFVPSGFGKDISVSIEGSKGKVTCSQEKAIESVFKYTYIPKQNGQYRITVIIGPKAKAITLEYTVIVPSISVAGLCKVWGSGVSPRGIQVQKKVQIYVEPTILSEKQAAINLTITGPEGDLPFIEEESNGVYTYTYQPPKVGKYSITISYQDNALPSCPFTVNVTDISKVRISGVGIDGAPVPVKKKLTLSVDVKEAGPGLLACLVLSPDQNEMEKRKAVTSPKCSDNKDGTYEVAFTPVFACQEALAFSFDDIPISQSPVKFNIFDVTKVKVHGQGIQDGNVANQPTYFMVNTSEAGPGELEVELTGPTLTTVDVFDAGNDLFKCEYTPQTPGDYAATVVYSGLPTVDSPFKFQVISEDEVPAIAVYGPALESGITVGTSAEFFVDFNDQPTSILDVQVHSPMGEVKVKKEQVEENITKHTFPVREPGLYTIGVVADGKAVAKSPFQVESSFPENAIEVTATGNGLDEAYVKEWTHFDVDFHRAGPGALTVSIDGPAEAETKVESGKNGIASVEYLPPAIGEYTIHVRFTDQEIPGSPFLVKAVSREGVDGATEVVQLEKQGVKLGSSFEYSIDTTRSPISESLAAKVVGPFVKDEIPEELLSKTMRHNSQILLQHGAIEAEVFQKEKVYTVKFTPKQVGVYLIYIFFGNNLIDSMPYELYVCDPTLIKIKGNGLQDKTGESCLVNTSLAWEADCRNAGPGSLKAYVAGPENHSKDFDIDPIPSKEDQYCIRYTPTQPGSYQILFAYSGFDLADKPTFMISDPSKASIQEGEKICLVGENVSFTVDLSSAGAGRLQVNLEGPVEIPIDYKKNGDGTCTFSFTPTEAGKYSLNVSFGDKPLTDQPMEVSAIDPEKIGVYGSGVTGKGARVSHPAEITVNCTESGIAPLEASLKTPDEQVLPLQLVPTDDENVFKTEYVPEIIGYHELSLTFADKPIQGSPFNVPIAEPDNVTVSETGPLFVAPGETCQLECFTESAGPGILTATLQTSDDEEQEATVNELDDQGHYEVSFKVPSPGRHKGMLYYNDHPIGSPVEIIGGMPPKCEVEGPGVKRKVAAERDTYFTVDTTESGPGSVKVVIHTPDDLLLPVEITQEEETMYEVCYVPKVLGEYTIDVTFDDIPLANSPYKTTCIDVAPLQLKPKQPDTVKVGEEVEMVADLSTAVEGDFNVSVQGPEECPIICKQEAGLHSFAFTAKTPGVYAVIATYDDLPITEDPLTVAVIDIDRVDVHGSGLTGKGVRPGQVAEVIVDTSESGPAPVAGVLSTPAGESVPLEFKSETNQTQDVQVATYIPQVPGKYKVDITFDGEPVAESPFIAHIVNLEEAKLDGAGVEEAAIGQENIIDLYLPMIEPEEITMQLLTSDQQELPLNFTVDKIDDDNCQIKYVPKVEAVCECNLCYAGNPLCDPFSLTIGDPSKVKVSGPAMEEDKLQAQLETYLNIDSTEAGPGKPKALITTPTDTEVEMTLTEIEDKVYKATYTPEESGPHIVSVLYCGHNVPSSPFTMDVFNPSAVKCTPSEPDRYELGEVVVLKYDVSQAGPGEFSMNIKGPGETEITQVLEDDLLVFTFTPTEVGVYEVSATFNEVPCREEPLKICITDPEKVSIYGSGVTGKGACVGQPVEVIIDTSKSGPLPLEGTVTTPTGQNMPLKFEPADDEKPEILSASYIPEMSGYHMLDFTLDNKPFSQRASRVYIVNPDDFKLKDEGTQEATLGEVNVFECYLDECPEDGEFGVLVEDEDGQQTMIECTVVRIDENNWRVEYVPELETAQFVIYCFNEVPIGEKVPIATIDLSECTVSGLENGAVVNMETTFNVDVTSVEALTKYNLVVAIEQADESTLEATIVQTDEGHYEVAFTPTVIGPLSLLIKYGGVTLGGSAFIVYVVDPSAVVCTGLDETSVLVEDKIVFAVDTSAAGLGAKLEAYLEGPEGSTVSCQAVGDGHYSGVVSAVLPGECKLYIQYANLDVPHSPFICCFNRPEADATKCSISDLENPGNFMVDCRDGGGNGILEVAVYGAYVPANYVGVKHNGDYTFSVSYDIPDPVETIISVKWHGQHLQGSPFKVVFKK